MTNNKCNCVTCEAFNNGEVYYSEDNQVYNACETFKLYQFEMSDADWEDYYKVLLQRKGFTTPFTDEGVGKQMITDLDYY